MAIQYYASLNLNSNQIMNATMHNLASAPDNPLEGQMYFNTVSKALYVWNGTAWVSASGEYVHPNDGGGSLSGLTGATVISGITVNTAGHVTATTTRNLTPADIGAAPVSHSHGTYDRATSALSGANIFSDIVVADGIVTGISTRALTAGDIGAATSGHNHTLDSLSNVTITTNSNGEILKWNGTAWVNNTLAEANIAAADHTHGTFDNSTALTGANVYSNVQVTDGIVTGLSTRALSAADIGAATSGHTHTYAQVLTSLTGANSAAANGQLLIGDGTDFTKATLTQGANVTITNAAGSITIASTDTNTTYGISAETTTGGANLRLSGSDTSTDDVAIKGSGATTVTRTDANTITITSVDTNTTYTATSPITLNGTEFGHSTADGDLHVPATGTTNNAKFLKAGATAGSLSWANVTKTDVGLANVTNDAQVKKLSSSTVGYIPTWSVTTGDALGAGYAVETTLTGSSSAIPRADAVKTYVDGVLGANDAMIFKGTVGTGGTHTIAAFNALVVYNAGWAYKVIEAGTIKGVACEVGDMLIATVDRASGGVNGDWVVIQSNIDGAVTGPASSTTGNLPTFSGATGKVIQDSGVALTSLAPKASPALTGTPTAPTAAADTNTTQLATTAFVVGQASSSTPLANSGAGAVGTSLRYARADHVHPATSLKYSGTIVGGSASEVITHNLNNRDVVVQLYRVASPYDTVYCDVERTTVNTITLRFNPVPAAGEFRVVITA